MARSGAFPNAHPLFSLRTRTGVPLRLPQFRDFATRLGLLRRLRIPRTRELVDLARPVSVTFHRAFDMAINLPAAPAVAPAMVLDQVIDSGADRVLTSGGESSAEQALDALQALIHAARNRIDVIVCGGVREHNVRRILALRKGWAVGCPSPLAL